MTMPPPPPPPPPPRPDPSIELHRQATEQQLRQTDLDRRIREQERLLRDQRDRRAKGDQDASPLVQPPPARESEEPTALAPGLVLSPESSAEIANPTPADLHRVIGSLDASNGFFILDRSSGGGETFFQCALGTPSNPEAYIVEYREAGEPCYYSSTASDAMQVMRLASGWAIQRVGWSSELTWEQIPL